MNKISLSLVLHPSCHPSVNRFFQISWVTVGFLEHQEYHKIPYGKFMSKKKHWNKHLSFVHAIFFYKYMFNKNNLMFSTTHIRFMDFFYVFFNFNPLLFFLKMVRTNLSGPNEVLQVNDAQAGTRVPWPGQNRRTPPFRCFDEGRRLGWWNLCWV